MADEPIFTSLAEPESVKSGAIGVVDGWTVAELSGSTDLTIVGPTGLTTGLFGRLIVVSLMVPEPLKSASVGVFDGWSGADLSGSTDLPIVETTGPTAEVFGWLVVVSLSVPEPLKNASIGVFDGWSVAEFSEPSAGMDSAPTGNSAGPKLRAAAGFSVDMVRPVTSLDGALSSAGWSALIATMALSAAALAAAEAFVVASDWPRLLFEAAAARANAAEGGTSASLAGLVTSPAIVSSELTSSACSGAGPVGTAHSGDQADAA